MNEFLRAQSQDSELRELLQRAGPRQQVPAGQFDSIKAAAREEWERVVVEERERSSLPWGRPALALAAALALALLGAWWWRGALPGAVSTIASVERLAGEVTVLEADEALAPTLAEGAALSPGMVLLTGGREGDPSRVALRLEHGGSIRLDEASRLRLVSANEVELQAGALYFDSGANGSTIAIDTAFGTVRNVGTRFEVRLDGSGADVTLRVRQGRAALETASGSLAASEGEELVVASDGAVTRNALAPTAELWAWAAQVAPPFTLEGASLSAFLDWASREGGWRVRYEDSELADAARTNVLSGSIEGFTPAEAINTVMPGSGVAYRIVGDELHVSRR